MEQVTPYQLERYIDLSVLLHYVTQLNQSMFTGWQVPLPEPPDDFEAGGCRGMACNLHSTFESLKEGGSEKRHDFYLSQRDQICVQLVADVNGMIANLIAMGVGKDLHPIVPDDLIPMQWVPDQSEIVCNDVVEALCPAILDSVRQAGDVILKLEKAKPESLPKPEDRQKADRVLLRGWHRICAALKRPKNEWRGLKRMNEKHNGPIKSLGRGQPPVVFEDALRSWLDAMMEQKMKAAKDTVADKGTLPDGFAWGKKGQKFFPEVGMGEKRRRKDLGSKKQKKNDQD